METIDIIKNIIYKVSGVEIINVDDNLLGPDCPIRSYLFLYVFIELEDYFQKEICKIFENHDYTIFSVRNIANAIDELR